MTPPTPQPTLAWQRPGRVCHTRVVAAKGGTSIVFQQEPVTTGDRITSVTSGQDKGQDGQRTSFRVMAHNQRWELVAEYQYTCLWPHAEDREPANVPRKD